MRSASRRGVVWCSAVCVMIAAVSCSEDLPEQGALPPGSETNGQTAADGGPAEGAAGAAGATMTAGSAGAAGMSAAGMGGGAAGSSSGGGGASGSMSGTAAGSSAPSGSAGSAGARPSGGAAGSSGPPVRVIAACMGRGGETICDGLSLIKCGAMGNAEMQMNCDTQAQCRAGLAAGTCGSCDPGTVECMGAELRECSMAGEFAVLDTCETEALCNKAGKACDMPACEADEYSCESGSLLKCAEDRTEFEQAESCPAELCDAAGKKCNVCVPSSKECQGSTTLSVCSADGTAAMEMECSGMADKCVKDRCVQCTADSDCPVDSDCQTASCNVESGMCALPAPKTVGTACSQNGGKVCDLLGSCVACVTDFDCAADERCSALLGCVPRAALQVGLSILPGTFSVTVNAGYRVEVSDRNLGSRSVDYGSLLALRSGTITQTSRAEIIPTFTDAVSYTFTGPAGSICLATSDLSNTVVRLRFASEPVDESSPGGNCDEFFVELSAFEGGS